MNQRSMPTPANRGIKDSKTPSIEERKTDKRRLGLRNDEGVAKNNPRDLRAKDSRVSRDYSLHRDILEQSFLPLDLSIIRRFRDHSKIARGEYNLRIKKKNY